MSRPGSGRDVDRAGWWRFSLLLIGQAAVVDGTVPLYAKPSFQSDATGDFVDPVPSSLHFNDGSSAMVFGGPGAAHPKLKLRVAATPGANFEVVLDTAILGKSFMVCKVDVSLLASDGTVVVNQKRDNLNSELDRIAGTTSYQGLSQIVIPPIGQVAPAEVAQLEVFAGKRIAPRLNLGSQIDHTPPEKMFEWHPC